MHTKNDKMVTTGNQCHKAKKINDLLTDFFTARPASGYNEELFCMFTETIQSETYDGRDRAGFFFVYSQLTELLLKLEKLIKSN